MHSNEMLRKHCATVHRKNDKNMMPLTRFFFGSWIRKYGLSLQKDLFILSVNVRLINIEILPKQFDTTLEIKNRWGIKC